MINLNREPELISKEIILRHVQDIEVYQRYVDFQVNTGKPVKSPLRDEENESFGFFIGETGELCFKDFVLGGGDFVRFVQLMFNLSYFEALSQIATDFNIEGCIYRNMGPKAPSVVKQTLSREEVVAKAAPIKIGKRARKWMPQDKQFWTDFGITLTTLKKYRVEPIDYMFINGVPIKAEEHAYSFTENKDGKETYKIYQPFSEKNKWVNNHDNSVWQGWEQLPPTGFELIITKSLKDVMAIDSVCGIPAVSLQSENISPKRHVFEELRKRFKHITLLYDNDFDKEVNWGKTFGKNLAQELGLVDVYIDEKFKCKDFSDLVKSYGPTTAREILEKETMLAF